MSAFSSSQDSERATTTYFGAAPSTTRTSAEHSHVFRATKVFTTPLAIHNSRHSPPDEPTVASRITQSESTDPSSTESAALYIPPHLRNRQKNLVALGSSLTLPVYPSNDRPLATGLQVGLGRQLLVLDVEQIPRVDDAKFEEVIACGGFKWVEGARPTIAIPAVPDIWLEQQAMIGSICKDIALPGNQEWPDYHTAHLPEGSSQHDPTILALERPNVILPTLSIVTGRNNLRKLHVFCHSSSGSTTDSTLRPVREGFRIAAHLAPGTDLVLLDRWEPPRQRRPRPPLSWHLSYHEQATMPSLGGSDRTPGCQRLVRYTFGGVGVLVKFDCDAYLPQPSEMAWLDLQTEVDQRDQVEADQTDCQSVTSDCSARSDRSISTEATHGSVPPDNDAQLDPWTTRIGTTTTSTGLVILHTSLAHPPQDALITIKTRGLPPPTYVQDKRVPCFLRSSVENHGRRTGRNPLPAEPAASAPDLEASVEVTDLINLASDTEENITSAMPSSYSKSRDPTRTDPLDLTKLHEPSQMYHQLLYSQLSHLYLALHRNGDFSVHPLLKLHIDGPELAPFREENRPAVDKVAGILHFIVAVTKRFGRVGIIGRPDGVIEVRELKEPLGQLSREASAILKNALVQS